MASSGMEVHWAEPGLGKGPQRQCWAWAEEEKGADGSGTCSWGAEGPFPKALSPELLEDFRLTQQHLQPLEWDPDPQPDGLQDSESGESVGEGKTNSANPAVASPKHPAFWPEGVLETFKIKV